MSSPGDIWIDFKTQFPRYDDGMVERVIDLVRDSARDLKLDSDAHTPLFWLDDDLDAIGIRSQPVAPTIDAGGLFQIFAGDETTPADVETRALYIKHNTATTSAIDSAVHRGIHIDFDNTFDNGAGIFSPTIRVFHLDIDIDRVASSVNTPNIEAYFVDIQGTSTTKLASTGTFDSPYKVEIRHPTSTTANIPSAGYIINYVEAGAGAGLSTSFWAKQNRFKVLGVGGTGNDTICVDNVIEAVAGHAANLICHEAAVWPVSTCSRVINYSAVPFAGTFPSWDRVMGLFSHAHVLAQGSLIAANAAADPSAVSADHLDFTSTTRASLYVEDDAEIDGISYFDGGFVHNEAGADVDARMESLNEPNMLMLDASLDAIGINGVPVAASATAGGSLQVFSGGTDGAVNTDTEDKAVYVRSNSPITSGNDFGVHRALHADYDYNYDVAAALTAAVLKPFEIDIDAVVTAGTDVGATLTPFVVDTTATDIAVGSSQFSYTHPATVASDIPTAGYFRVDVNHDPGSALAGSLIGAQISVGAKLSGSGNNATALNVINSPKAGFTAIQRGILTSLAGVSGASKVVGIAVIQAGGTMPSLDKVIGVDSAWHIHTSNSLVASGSADLTSLSNDHVSLTDGSSNAYIEDSIEVDGAAFFDAAVSFAIASVTTNTTLDATYHTVLVDASSGDVTITLPAASSNDQRIYRIKKIDSSSNVVKIDGNASETIDDDTEHVLYSQYSCAAVQCDGTEWWVV